MKKQSGMTIAEASIGILLIAIFALMFAAFYVLIYRQYHFMATQIEQETDEMQLNYAMSIHLSQASDVRHIAVMPTNCCNTFTYGFVRPYNSVLDFNPDDSMDVPILSFLRDSRVQGQPQESHLQFSPTALYYHRNTQTQPGEILLFLNTDSTTNTFNTSNPTLRLSNVVEFYIENIQDHPTESVTNGLVHPPVTFFTITYKTRKFLPNDNKQLKKIYCPQAATNCGVDINSGLVFSDRVHLINIVLRNNVLGDAIGSSYLDYIVDGSGIIREVRYQPKSKRYGFLHFLSLIKDN